MAMTDTDHLSTPADMVDFLKRLTTIVRDVEAMPDNAQQRFWQDVDHGLNAVPRDELRIDAATVSMRTVTIFHNILANMFGPKLAEMVRGESAEQLEKMIVTMKEATVREPSDWDTFLNEQFAAVKDTERDGTITAQVSLTILGNIGCGSMRRVDGASKLLKLSIAGSENSVKERHFSSRDIVMMEFVRLPEAP